MSPRRQGQIFKRSPDVSLQDLGSGCVSELQKYPRVKETHVGSSGRVVFLLFWKFKTLIVTLGFKALYT